MFLNLPFASCAEMAVGAEMAGDSDIAFLHRHRCTRTRARGHAHNPHTEKQREYGETETRRHGETRRRGDTETRRHGDAETETRRQRHRETDTQTHRHTDGEQRDASALPGVRVSLRLSTPVLSPARLCFQRCCRKIVACGDQVLRV